MCGSLNSKSDHLVPTARETSPQLLRRRDIQPSPWVEGYCKPGNAIWFLPDLAETLSLYPAAASTARFHLPSKLLQLIILCKGTEVPCPTDHTSVSVRFRPFPNECLQRLVWR